MSDLERSLTLVATVYQEILRLADWDVTIKIKSRHAMDALENVGQIATDAQERTAQIDILDPRELPLENRSTAYLESIILHELLHLYHAEGDEEHVVRKTTKVVGKLIQELICRTC